MNYLDQIKDLLTNSKHTKWICPLLILADALLCALIIWKIPCTLSAFPPYRIQVVATLTLPSDTEIDWKAYMEQVQQYIAGERNYDKIKGGTGPLVYPGMHVYIYRLLHDLTDEGRDIGLAQIIFAGVYLVNEAVVMWCYRLAKVRRFPSETWRREE